MSLKSNRINLKMKFFSPSLKMLNLPSDESSEDSMSSLAFSVLFSSPSLSSSDSSAIELARLWNLVFFAFVEGL